MGGGGLFSGSSTRWLEGVELESNIEDENVSHVEGVGGRWDLADDGLVQLSLDVEETGLVLFWFDVLESSFNTSFEDFELVEEFEERVRFRSLNFTVLDRQSAQEVIEFDGLVGSSTSFVKSGVLSKPKVDIVQHLVFLLVGVENDV